MKHYDPTTFKAYDIRGVVPEQIDADLAEQIGRAFANQFKPKEVVVCRDVRPTGVEFQERVTRGLTKSGVSVIDAGQVSTDIFYYACAKLDAPGIMVTASHNPKEYNGFKMVKKMPNPVIAKEFRPHVLDETYNDAEQAGSVREVDLLDDFIRHMLSIVAPKNLKPFKVVVDTSNGAQGAVWERLAPQLPVTVVPLCFEADGSFPNHGNDVSQAENQSMLRDAVIAEQADVGLIFDPDGDRCMLVDDKGRTVPGDIITALLGVELLKHQPGSAIVYDIRASDVVPHLIKKAGGKPIVWKPGHAYIKPKMQELDAIFGGEITGHYFFKNFWFADCGLLAGLTMLEYISGLAGNLSDAIDELTKQYVFSPEINSKVEDVASVLAEIKSRYGDAEISEISGIAIRYTDWHAAVRPSDNEPLVRLTVEGKTRELMEAKRDELLEIIRS